MRPIDADALSEILKMIANEYKEMGETLREKAVICAVKCLESEDISPTLDYAPVVHGEWEERTRTLSWCDDDVDVYFVCSACKEENYGKTLFCPNCGAKTDRGRTLYEPPKEDDE